VLHVHNLSIGFGATPTMLVEGMALSLQAGHTLALVGESGCGKSITSLALLGLLPPPLRVLGGTALLEGRDILALKPDALRRVRGRRIGLILQEPMTALNPAFTIAEQIIEAITAHQKVPRRAAREQAASLLGRMRIPDPARVLDEYPHRLSGGMRQRVVIAIAMAGQPQALFADEPTTALDVTVQAQILALLRELQQGTGLALLLITHNLGVVAQSAQRVAVMYAGRLVEEGPTADIFARAAHPYTQGLLAATPRPGRRTLPVPIPGTVPPPGPSRWRGCAFAARCPAVVPACHDAPPPLADVGSDHRAACIRVAA
jgi:peptide/nickel transport system ATP-binding protein